MSRIIEDLEWARPISRPNFIPKSRPRGAKAAGLRYERAIGKALADAVSGQWFEFSDRNGKGVCQVDHMLLLASGQVILEAKYTWTLEGHQQLERLYRPVVELALKRPAICILVCKRLVPQMRGITIVGGLEEALAAAASGARVALQWLGGVPLGPPKGRLARGHSSGLSPAIALP